MLVECTMLLTVLGLTGVALAQAGGATPANVTHVIDIRQLRFQPAVLTVSPGDTVVWINRDIVPHTLSALDAEWESEGLMTDGSWRRLVTGKGSVEYYCTYHPTMRGTIVLEGV